MKFRFAPAIAAACLILLSFPALAKAPADDDGVPTVVLVHDSLGELHYLSDSLHVPYISTSGVYLPPPTTGADVVAGALGGAIAGLIINHEARVAAQRQVDKELLELTDVLGKKGLQAILRQAFADTLPAHGMRQQALTFTGGSKLEPKLLSRLPAARGAERFLLVGSAGMANGPLWMPLAMHDSFRQFRLAIDVELRSGRYDRSRRDMKRDVVVYTDPMQVAEGTDPLALLAADDQARLRTELGRAVADALTLALAEREFPDVPKGDAVGSVSAVGLTEFEGVLMEHVDGRALIWTRDKSLVSIPAERIVTGEALVAAREVQAEVSAKAAAQAALDAAAEAQAAADAAPAVWTAPDAAPATEASSPASD